VTTKAFTGNPEPERQPERQPERRDGSIGLPIAA